MSYVVVAIFPKSGDKRYLNGMNQFDEKFEHARLFETVEDAETSRSNQKYRSWSMVKNRRRVAVVPEYVLECA